jgi:cohesin loading factor subunit SCC2
VPVQDQQTQIPTQQSTRTVPQLSHVNSQSTDFREADQGGLEAPPQKKDSPKKPKSNGSSIPSSSVGTSYRRETAGHIREKHMEEFFNLAMDIVLEFDRIDEGEYSSVDHATQFKNFKGMVVSDPYLKRLRSSISEFMQSSIGRIPLKEHSSTVEGLQKAVHRSLHNVEPIFTMQPIKQLENSLYANDIIQPVTELTGLFQGVLNSIGAAKVSLLIMQCLGDSHEEIVTVQSDEMISELCAYIKELMQSVILPLCSLSVKTQSRLVLALREMIESVLAGAISVVRYLRAFIQNTEANESLFTQLDTMSSNILLTKLPDSGVVVADSVDPLYVEAMNVLVIVTRSYSDIKTTLLEISSQFYLLDSGKKSFPRRYRVPQLKAGISVFSALVMKIVQNCYALPPDVSTPASEGDADAPKENNYLEQCQSAYERANSGCSGFISSLLIKLRDQSSGIYKSFFDVFVKDVLDVLLLPEWPAAELLVQNLITWLKHLISDKKPKIDVNVRLQTIAIDTLGKVEAGLRNVITTISGESHSHIELARISPDEINDCCTVARSVLGRMNNEKERRLEYQSSYGYLLTQLYLSLSKITRNQKTSLEAREAASKCMEVLVDDNNTCRMTDVDFAAMYSKFLAYRPFKGYSDVVIKCLCNELTESKRMVKAKIISVLSDLIDSDSKIFLNNHVRQALEKNLSDSSVTVREKAVQIVGKYSAYPEFANDSYYALLCGHTNDPATAVRKKAISVLRNVYMTGRCTLETRRRIINCMLDRIDDEEEGIQKTVRDNLKETLFANWSFGNQSDPNSYASTKNTVLRVVEILPSTIVMGGSEHQTRLRELLHKFLSETLNGVDTDKTHYLQCAETIVDTLTDLASNEEDTRKQDLMLESISIFVRARNGLIQPRHLNSLKHLVTQEVKDNRYSRYLVLVIFRDGLNGMAEIPDNDLLKYLVENLPRMISRVSHREIKECVPCFWLACDLLSNRIPCVKLMDKCLSQISQRLQAVKSQGLDEKSLNICKRLLNIIGVSARYFQLEDAEFKQMTSNKNQRKNATILAIDTMMPVASGVISPQAPALSRQLKKCALQAIGDACMGNPASFRSVGKLYSAILKSNDYESASIVINTMYEFCEAQEANADTLARESAVQKKKKKKDGPIDITNGSYSNIEASTCLEFAKLYGADIRKIALSSVDEPGLLATKFIEVTVRQGAAFPQDVTPVAIALETSDTAEISNLAKKALRHLFSKYEQAMSPHYISGLKLAAQYCKHMYPTRYYQLKNKLDSFYGIFTTKSMRKRLFKSIAKSLNYDVTSANSNDVESHLEYVAFMVRNLSCLDIVDTDEVTALTADLKEVLLSSGMLVDERYNELINNNVDDSERWRNCGILSLIFHILCQFLVFLKRAYHKSSDKSNITALRLDQFDLNPKTFDDVMSNKARCHAFSEDIGIYLKEEERKRKAQEDDDDDESELTTEVSTQQSTPKQPRLE